MTVHELDVYNWKPITATEYLDQLDYIFLASRNCPPFIRTVMETLDDGRKRMITYASVSKRSSSAAEESKIGPYLMVLIPENRPKICFMRTDVFVD